MANVNASAASSVRFDFALATPVNVVTPVSGSSIRFEYQSNAPSRVIMNGSAFVYDISGALTAGLVKRVRLDYEFLGTFQANIDIKKLNVRAEDLFVPGTPDEQYDAFISNLLAGDDVFTVGGSFSGMGDFLSVTQGETLTGGNDVISGFSQTLDQPMAGDAFEVIGGRVNGGNDRITGESDLGGGGDNTFDGDLFLAGETLTLDGGRVSGGDDIIKSLGGGPLTEMAGSVLDLIAGRVDGGNDRITGSGDDDKIAGDTFEQTAGRTFGGNDELKGADGVDTLSGDTLTLNAGRVFGGDDIILGQSGDDMLAGDVYLKTGGKVVGGDDVLKGGAGNDILHGDVFDGREATGGNDTLRGNGGNDRLYGDKGADKLFGNGGSDELYGGGGADVLNGGGGDDALDGGAGKDTYRGGAGSDTFVIRVEDSLVGARDRVLDFTLEDTLSIVAPIGISAVDQFSGVAGEMQRINAPGSITFLGDFDGDGLADFSLAVTITDGSDGGAVI